MRGENMIYVIGELKLENYDKWKPVFNERSTIRKESGSKEARLFRNSDDPHEVAILFMWDNKENAKKYMESESLQKTLQNAGAKIKKITYFDEIEKTI
jgi:heme-degrading monooxygenase HmoA